MTNGATDPHKLHQQIVGQVVSPRREAARLTEI